jgi:hypothetical protein
VLVEDRLGDARRDGEVVHRGGVEAAIGELDARHIEELTAPFVGPEARGRRAPGAVHPPVLDFRGIS